jgi:hypothetical protein
MAETKKTFFDILLIPERAAGEVPAGIGAKSRKTYGSIMG